MAPTKQRQLTAAKHSAVMIEEDTKRGHFNQDVHIRNSSSRISSKENDKPMQSKRKISFFESKKEESTKRECAWNSLLLTNHSIMSTCPPSVVVVIYIVSQIVAVPYIGGCDDTIIHYLD